jgi:hypothetical protein
VTLPRCLTVKLESNDVRRVVPDVAWRLERNGALTDGTADKCLRWSGWFTGSGITSPIDGHGHTRLAHSALSLFAKRCHGILRRSWRVDQMREC